MPNPNALSLEDWITHEAIPFSLDNDQSLSALTDKLLAACDPALEILALGEPTHLVNDYLRLRNRLFQTLVQRHNFSAIAIESSFTRGPIANDFIAGQHNSLDQAVDQGITHNMGRMPANLELLQWMRDYNANPAHPTKLHFYGFDSPTEMAHADSPRQLLNLPLDYLATLNPTSAHTRRQLIDPLFANDADWENPAAMMDPTKSIGRSQAANTLRIATEDLITELQILQPQAITTDAPAYHRAMRYAIHARQMLAYHAAAADSSPDRFTTLLAHRDNMMADNLLHIAHQEKPSGKLFAFAHNTHLKRGQAVWQWGQTRFAWYPAGAHLSAALSSKYAVIGTATATSTASQLPAPEPHTLEALLLTTPGPLRLIPTHSIKSLNTDNLPTRTTNPRYFPFDPASLTDFDFLTLMNKAE